MPSNFRDDLLAFFEEQFARRLELEPGKMMGHPGFKLAHNGKFVIFLYEDGVTLKLPDSRYHEILQWENVTPFNPMQGKKPMSTWVVWICDDPSEYMEHWDLVEEVVRSIAAEPPNPRKKRKV